MIQDILGQMAYTDKPPLTPPRNFPPNDLGYSPQPPVTQCPHMRKSPARNARLYYGPVRASLVLMTEMTPEDLRLTIEGDVLGVISGHGGEVIVAGPESYQMVQELTDLVIGWRAR